jgi:hypothetical protein
MSRRFFKKHECGRDEESESEYQTRTAVEIREMCAGSFEHWRMLLMWMRQVLS